jgi:hypothetical protein
MSQCTVGLADPVPRCLARAIEPLARFFRASAYPARTSVPGELRTALPTGRSFTLRRNRTMLCSSDGSTNRLASSWSITAALTPPVATVATSSGRGARQSRYRPRVDRAPRSSSGTTGPRRRIDALITPEGRARSRLPGPSPPRYPWRGERNPHAPPRGWSLCGPRRLRAVGAPPHRAGLRSLEHRAGAGVARWRRDELRTRDLPRRLLRRERRVSPRHGGARLRHERHPLQ